MILFSVSLYTLAFLSLWTMLLCLAGILEVIQNAADKQYGKAGLAGLLLCCNFLFYQVENGIHEYHKTGLIGQVNLFLARCPLWLFLVLLILSSLALIILQRQWRHFHREHLTPSHIRLCADHMPCGMCYWNDNGRVIFSNSAMIRLCIELTGKPLLDGRAFRQFAGEGILKAGGKIWNIVHHDLTYQESILHETIAMDITEIYQKTEELRKENEELYALTEELRELSLSIDDVVRREETLRAKVNIHDEMNRLMLTTDAADPKNADEMGSILSLWERNALLLCMEADRSTSDQGIRRLEEFAQALGIQLSLKNSISAVLSENQRELFFIAAREAVANAVKHAEAKNLWISVEKQEGRRLCRFENDGRVLSTDICFTGGLANLEHLASQQNARLKAEILEGRYCLYLIFEEKKE